MSKVSNKYYSTAIRHSQIDGIYMAMFAIPGEVSHWLTDGHGQPRQFTSYEEAELAGFRAMVARLNRSRVVQSFVPRKKRDRIRSYHAPKQSGEPTAASVFGKK